MGWERRASRGGGCEAGPGRGMAVLAAPGPQGWVSVLPGRLRSRCGAGDAAGTGDGDGRQGRLWQWVSKNTAGVAQGPELFQPFRVFCWICGVCNVLDALVAISEAVLMSGARSGCWICAFAALGAVFEGPFA